MLSRTVSVIRCSFLIINLTGSPKEALIYSIENKSVLL